MPHFYETLYGIEDEEAIRLHLPSNGKDRAASLRITLFNEKAFMDGAHLTNFSVHPGKPDLKAWLARRSLPRVYPAGDLIQNGEGHHVIIASSGHHRLKNPAFHCITLKSWKASGLQHTNSSTLGEPLSQGIEMSEAMR